jgi:hypothetical protein
VSSEKLGRHAFSGPIVPDRLFFGWLRRTDLAANDFGPLSAFAKQLIYVDQS